MRVVATKTKAVPAEPVEPDRISENVKAAPDEAAAWGALSRVAEVPLSPARRQFNDEAAAVDHAIAKGWKVLAEWEQSHTDPPPASWVERLVQLHAEQLDKFFDLDRIRLYEAETLGLDIGTLAGCVLDRALAEGYGYLRDVPAPGGDVAAAMVRLGGAFDVGDADAALSAAKDYVGAAVRRRYGGKG